MINIATYFRAEDGTSCSSAANPIFSPAALMAPFTLSYSPVKHLGPGKWFQTPQILLIIQSRRGGGRNPPPCRDWELEPNVPK